MDNDPSGLRSVMKKLRLRSRYARLVACWRPSRERIVLALASRVVRVRMAWQVSGPVVTPVALRIEHQVKEMKLAVGHDFTFRFKLIDTATGNPKSDLKDVRVLTFLSPGVWQRRDIATPVGDGVYELKVTVPQTGLYMLFVESSSMGVRYVDLPYLMLQATE